MEKKRAFCRISTLLFSLAFLVLLSACTTDGKNYEDISSLEIKNTSQVCEPIDFETAIKLEAKVTASIDRYAEENHHHFRLPQQRFLSQGKRTYHKPRRYLNPQGIFRLPLSAHSRRNPQKVFV